MDLLNSRIADSSGVEQHPDPIFKKKWVQIRIRPLKTSRIRPDIEQTFYLSIKVNITNMLYGYIYQCRVSDPVGVKVDPDPTFKQKTGSDRQEKLFISSGYEPTIPAKFLLGTHCGTVVSCLKKGKDKVQSRVLPDIREIVGMDRIASIKSD